MVGDMKLTDRQNLLLEKYGASIVDYYKYQKELQEYLAEQGSQEAQQSFLGMMKGVNAMIVSLVAIIEDESHEQ